jgi:hypothetical protein
MSTHMGIFTLRGQIQDFHSSTPISDFGIRSTRFFERFTIGPFRKHWTEPAYFALANVVAAEPQWTDPLPIAFSNDGNWLAVRVKPIVDEEAQWLRHGWTVCLSCIS